MEEKIKEELECLLAGKSRIYKMTKEGKGDFYFDFTNTFYFDSTDLLNHKDYFIDMRKNGWEVSEDKFEELSAYLPARRQTIAEAGFKPSGWGYRR